ncbi:HAD family hydrolase [Lysobacter sp. A286]
MCSNAAHAYATRLRELLPDLDAYALSCEVGECKPAPAMYHAVIQSLSAQPRHALFIGDSPRADLEGPLAFGMKAALLDRSRESLDELLSRELGWR